MKHKEGEWRFLCRYCEKGFDRSDGWAEHEKRCRLKNTTQMKQLCEEMDYRESFGDQPGNNNFIFDRLTSKC